MRLFWRWVLLIAGFCTGSVGLFMVIGGLTSHAGSTPGSGGANLVVSGIGAALFVAGWLLGALAFPAFTAFSGLLCAFVGALSAMSIGLVAIVLPRARPRGFDADRAATDAWVGAGFCLLIGAVLFLNWLLWRRRTSATKTTRSVLHATAVVWGVVQFLSGLLMAFAATVSMIQVRGINGSTHANLEAAVLLAGLAAISLGSGTILVWHGTAASAGAPSTRFRPPPVWVPLVLMVLAVGGSEALIQTDTAMGFMPLGQAVAVTMPGLAILALVSRAGEGLRAAAHSTWGELLLMVAYGASVATVIAGTINTLVITASVIVAMTANGSLNGVRNYNQFSNRLGHASDFLGTTGQLVPLLVSIAIIGPLNEEFWKGFGVRLLRGHHPTAYRAFLWGIASGVGFGATEVTQYGFAAFARSPYRWWDVVLLRGAASSMHALASGIVGIGWFYAFAGRRMRFLGLYLVAAGLHGSWNALNVLTAARVLPPFKSLSEHALEIVLEIVLAGVAVAIVFFLVRLARRLSDEEALPVEDLPPAVPPGDAPFILGPAAP